MDFSGFNGTGTVSEGSYTPETFLNRLEFKKQTSQFTASVLLVGRPLDFQIGCMDRGSAAEPFR
jgi:hypothetical protein